MYNFTSLIVVPMERGVLVSADMVEREQRVRVLYKPMKVLVEAVSECDLKKFVLMTRALDKRKCIQLV